MDVDLLVKYRGEERNWQEAVLTGSFNLSARRENLLAKSTGMFCPFTRGYHLWEYLIYNAMHGR